MKKTILNLDGVKVLNKKSLKQINGGNGDNACFWTCDAACIAGGSGDILEDIECSLDCWDLCSS
ncbi:bacteriocin [Tenacibaculum jejuense]|uniref:bacteriocin n=1 Tax=Tenacibaculum jejuense TaxID=584609 RepID=UPI000BA4D17A|nr:bacteriocin [Tenacibaculum jejuense]